MLALLVVQHYNDLNLFIKRLNYIVAEYEKISH